MHDKEMVCRTRPRNTPETNFFSYDRSIPYTEGPRLTRILGLGKKLCYMKFVLVGLY